MPFAMYKASFYCKYCFLIKGHNFQVINVWTTISVSILQSNAFEKNDHRNILMQTFTRDPVFKNKTVYFFIASEFI